MAYSAPSTISTGDLITAAKWNADVSANPIAIYAGAMSVASQAVGDILYASSTTQFARVAAVATGQVLASAGTGTVPAYSATPALTSVDMGGTTVYGSRAITVDTGGVLNIVLASSAGDDFTVDTTKLVVSGDSGAVGIGTASPQHELHVEGTSPVIRISDSNSTSEADAVCKLEFYDRNNTDLLGYIQAGDGSTDNLYINAWNARAIVFQNNGTTERMRIDSDGNVGIGKTPAYGKLDIAATGTGAQDRGLSVDVSPSSSAGDGPNNGVIFSAGNLHMDKTLFRIHHEAPVADQKLISIDTTGSNTEKFFVDEDGDGYFAGRVGIGTSDHNGQLHLSASSDTEIRLSSTGSNSKVILVLINDARQWQMRVAGDDSDNFQIRDANADAVRLTINTSGVVNVVGTFTAGTKTFQIPHPLPELKDTNYLIHGCLEGPRLDLIYRGTVTLVDGAATVDLDEAAGMSAGTWELLCRDEQVFTSNETGWFPVRGAVDGSTLTIDCEESDCTDTVSWLVVAERQDDEIRAQSSTDEEGHLIIEPSQLEDPSA